MDKTLSVFGSSGFIGSHFVSKYDSHKIPRECNTPIEDTDILYLISTTHNYHVFDNPFLDIETNLTKLVAVLQEFKKHCSSRKTFNFISSCFVYGDTEYPAKETTVCNPKGFYSITKLAAERLVVSYCETFNLNYRILRLCNVYGENATGVSKKRNALQFMVDQLINQDTVELYDNGDNKRDFMHVEDVCDAIKLCLTKGEKNDIINIGSGKPQEFRPLIEYAKNKIKSNSYIKNVDPPHFHKVVQVKDIYFDVSKLNNLGFKPKISIYEGIDKIIKEKL